MAEDQPAKWTLFCLVVNENTPFPVEIQSDKTVGVLKEAIKNKKQPEFDGFAADRLTLYLVNLLDDDNLTENAKQLLTSKALTALRATKQLGDLLPGGPAKETVHVLVQEPSGRK